MSDIGVCHQALPSFLLHHSLPPSLPPSLQQTWLVWLTAIASNWVCRCIRPTTGVSANTFKSSSSTWDHANGVVAGRCCRLVACRCASILCCSLIDCGRSCCAWHVSLSPSLPPPSLLHFPLPLPRPPQKRLSSNISCLSDNITGIV